MYEIQSSFIPGYFRKLGCIYTQKTNSVRFIEIIQNALLQTARNQDFVLLMIIETVPQFQIVSKLCIHATG